MKKINILAVAILLLTLGACNEPAQNKQGNEVSQNFNLDTTSLKKGDTFYQCEMDLEVISDKPGSCPKCEMDLTELKKH